jgi:predicted lipoprotein with Yx(FWY)xxD motif
MARTGKRTAGAALGAGTAALVVALGGCGGGDGGGDGGEGEASPTAERTQTGAGSPSPSPTGSRTATGGGAARVMLRSSGDLGRILTDGDGRTLYLFVADSSKKSTCYDACAEAWPPLTVSGEPAAGKGARADLLGTTERKGGGTQVTYNGHPLYYYEADDEPGETEGQGVDQFGAKWWVLGASGERVRGQADGPDQQDQDQQDQDQDRYGY